MSLSQAATEFLTGRPAGISSVSRSAGLLTSWVENGFNCSVQRDPAGLPYMLVAERAGRGIRLTQSFTYSAGALVGMTGDTIPTVFRAEVMGGQAPVSGALNQATSTFKPWKIATFGDSRSNLGSTGPDVSGSQSIITERAATWGAAFAGDCELVRNYGVSGDTASAWALTSRTGGKTFSDLANSDVDLVIMQYGINDAMSLTAAATIAGYLQAACIEILKSNKKLVFESIQPVTTAATNGAAAQVIADATNVLMATWIAQFPTVASYANTAAVLKDSATGYANTLYQNTDGVHTRIEGGRAAGPTVAAAIRTLLPQRVGLFPARDNRNPNMLSMTSPAAFINAELGTIGSTAITSGSDSSGFYVEYVFTPLTLGSGECKVRLETNANFLTSASPYYALAGAEMLQGSARVLVDNGSGGAPACYNVALRHRFFTAAVFRDMGTIPFGAPTANSPNLYSKLDATFIVPPAPNTAASVSATPASSSGWALQLYVETATIGTPIRVRLYNPQLRAIGYKPTPVSVTPPASTVAYTNATPVKQQVVISGGTVSAIAQGGVATGLTSGVFVLDPGDTLTLTYTVAPTMLVKHLA